MYPMPTSYSVYSTTKGKTVSFRQYPIILSLHALEFSILLHVSMYDEIWYSYGWNSTPNFVVGDIFQLRTQVFSMALFTSLWDIFSVRFSLSSLRCLANLFWTWMEFYSEFLIVMDNVSIHRLSMMKKYFNEKHLKVAFLPTYSEELAHVERYFFMLKKKVIIISYLVIVN